MGRSSRFVFLIGLVAATPALAQSRGGMVRMPTNLAARMPLQIVTPGVRSMAGQRAASLGAIRMMSARRGLAVRRNGFGLYGVGLGLSLASDLATPQVIVSQSLSEPDVIPGVSPPPCIQPQIIKIGLGLRHVARTRVIYGTPLVCSR